MEWLTLVINAVVTLLGIGGIGWIFTVRQDRRSKDLDNKAKENEIEDKKKADIIQDWKDIAEERKHRAEKLVEDNEALQERIIKKDEIITSLRTKIDNLNSYCAVAELLKCETLDCQSRKPPFASSIVSTSKSLTNFVNENITKD